MCTDNKLFKLNVLYKLTLTLTPKQCFHPLWSECTTPNGPQCSAVCLLALYFVCHVTLLPRTICGVCEACIT